MEETKAPNNLSTDEIARLAEQAMQRMVATVKERAARAGVELAVRETEDEASASNG